VSFAADIQPIFNGTCAAGGSSCHGDPGLNEEKTGQVFLGRTDGGVDSAQVLDVIVGKMSPEDAQMKIVSAGDPDASYLMHKLDDDQCLFASTCNATKNPVFANCGSGMPMLIGILDEASRDKIRRWIAQGAQGN
jgi:hypothetical protein